MKQLWCFLFHSAYWLINRSGSRCLKCGHVRFRRFGDFR